MAMQRKQDLSRIGETIEVALATSVGRRAVLALGARTVMGLCSVLGTGAVFGLAGSLASCYRAPGTARDQLIFFSEEKELQFGLSAYREVLRQAPLSNNPEINDVIQRVGKRIAQVANKPEYQWEFAVIEDDKTVNAFCLPGARSPCLPGFSSTRRMTRAWPR